MSYPKQIYIPAPTTPSHHPVSIKSSEEAILNAIRFCNIERCKEIIAEDPEILHLKGWNGQSPLHQACLTGQAHLVFFFLERGANPNSRNSFEETPLHYACRRGVVSVVHLMIKNGADSNAVDKKGRNCMHFAALGGSVVMLHYLRAHTELNFDTPDDTGRNVLHIGCEMRQLPMVSYITKHNRVDPSLRDLRGVTPLHLAIEKGNADIVWTILQRGGCELLHLENQKGETPLDVAKNAASEIHKGIYETLLPYAKAGSKGPPRGPVFMWYFLLFIPFVYLVFMFLCALYLNSYGGHFCLLMSIILIYYIGHQGHRIYHMSRWPNPIYLGTFVGGILHCAIAQFGYLQRALWPCPFTIIVVTSLAVLCLYLLWFLIFLDPGIDKSPKISQESGKPMSVLDIAEGRASDMDFNPFSETIHANQIKYCRLCEAPMCDMDHHCLFLNNCIAKNNHRHFLLLLIVVMALQISFIYCSAVYMQMISSHLALNGLGDPLTPYLGYFYKTEPWIFSLAMLCFVSCVWEATLIYAQCSVIMRGSTTYISLKQPHNVHRHITLSEKFRNLIQFILKSNSESRSTNVNKEAAPLLHA